MELIEQDGIRLFVGRDGTVVEAVSVGRGRMDFWIRGSSYRMTVSSAAFHSSFSERKADEGLSAGSFRGSWLPRSVRIKGYSSELAWNGWSCPHFTKHEGLRLAAFMGGQLRFDEGCDSFIDVPGDLGRETRYKGSDRQVEGGVMRLYGIGAGAWCWKRSGR